MFKRALIIADAHFGRSNNNPIANKDNLDFLSWAIDEARTWGAETCIMLGDWFHNRHTVGVGSIHAALRGLEWLSKSFDRSWFLTGNHDIFHRDHRDITSIEFAKHIPNIVLINDPLVVDDVSFWPWLMPDEHLHLDMRSRYIFGHLELAGFTSNSGYEIPVTDHAQRSEQFKQQDQVITGHFHRRQFSKNVTYVGNVMPFDFSDDGDSDRGVMLFEYGKEPFFKAWPEQPLFRSMLLSELIDNPDRLLRSNMTVRVTIDIPLHYEEAQEIKAMLTKAYGLRKFELLNGLSESVADTDLRSEFHTVDQIVIDGLKSIQSNELSTDCLVDIYNELATSS